MTTDKAASRKPTKRKKQSYYKDAFRRLIKNPLADICLVIVAFFVCVIIFADLIVPYDAGIAQSAELRLAPPSSEHPFGCDNMGRDMLSRMVHGSRVSLTMGLYVTAIVMLIGTVLGAASAFYGGIIDMIMMRICDLFMCIPGTLFALTMVAVLGPGLTNMLIAIVISSIPGTTRQFRSLMLNVIANDYIDAARACGTRDLRIIWKHILPNVMAYIVLSAAGSVAGMIMQIAGLSFLGLGVQPPDPEWGAMMSEARNYMLQAPHMMFVPGVALLIVTLTLSLLGDALRDVLDPRLRN